MSDKYFTFWVNNEKFNLETSELKKYDVFNKVMSNTNFKNEDFKIEFEINNTLVNIAHNLHNFKSNNLDISQIVQIYDYINFLIPINFDEIITNLLNQYKINNMDYDYIESLDDEIYLKLKKELLKIVFKFDITKTSQYIDQAPTRQIISKIQYYIDNPVYSGRIDLTNWLFGYKQYMMNSQLQNFIDDVNKTNNYIKIIYEKDYYEKKIIKYMDVTSTYTPTKKITYTLRMH